MDYMLGPVNRHTYTANCWHPTHMTKEQSALPNRPKKKGRVNLTLANH